MHLCITVSGCTELLGVSENTYTLHLIIISMSDDPILAPAFIPDNELGSL
jgi:hypothetical protein